jgi:hypothetical protein
MINFKIGDEVIYNNFTKGYIVYILDQGFLSQYGINLEDGTKVISDQYSLSKIS